MEIFAPTVSAYDIYLPVDDEVVEEVVDPLITGKLDDAVVVGDDDVIASWQGGVGGGDEGGDMVDDDVTRGEEGVRACLAADDDEATDF